MNTKTTDNASLGRISPEKGADRAIEIAKRVGTPLKIAAKVDRADRRYFKRVVEPLLNDPHVEWHWRRLAWLFAAYALFVSVRSLPASVKQYLQRQPPA